MEKKTKNTNAAAAWGLSCVALAAIGAVLATSKPDPLASAMMTPPAASLPDVPALQNTAPRAEAPVPVAAAAPAAPVLALNDPTPAPAIAASAPVLTEVSRSDLGTADLLQVRAAPVSKPQIAPDTAKALLPETDTAHGSVDGHDHDHDHNHDHDADTAAASPTQRLAALGADVIAPAAAENPAPKAKPAKKSVKAPACVKVLKTLAARTRIYFDSASATLDARGWEATKALATLAQTCDSARITITGFSDPSGNSAANLTLSWQRSKGVLNAISQMGFDASQFTAVSHMEDHPEHCVHFDAVDRRVEFKVSHVPAQATELSAQVD